MDTQDKSNIEAASNNDDIRWVDLDRPIKRGDSSFNKVMVKRPFGPALRGLSLGKLINDADYDTCEKLIPRITDPMISKEDIASGALTSSDLLQIVGEITDFFIPSKVRAGITPNT